MDNATINCITIKTKITDIRYFYERYLQLKMLYEYPAAKLAFNLKNLDLYVKKLRNEEQVQMQCFQEFEEVLRTDRSIKILV